MKLKMFFVILKHLVKQHSISFKATNWKKKNPFFFLFQIYVRDIASTSLNIKKSLSQKFLQVKWSSVVCLKYFGIQLVI